LPPNALVFGAEWNAMDLDQRKVYEDLSAADKKRYEKEKAIFYAN